MLTVIENWTAKRSGAHLTIEGTLDGKPVKLTNITEIQSGTPYPVAFDAHGNSHHLDASMLAAAAA